MASRKGDSGDGASPGKIFIGGLAKDTTLETFVKYFEKYGEITDSVIMKDRHTGRPRGFGFITYADPSVVDQVIQENHIINDKQVEIKRTIPKGSSQANDFKTKKIFVGGIPTSVSEDELKSFFSNYGKVVEHEIIRDHTTKRSRGFGFIVFDNEKVVDSLLSDGNMIDMDGTQVEIKKAEPKKSSNSGSLPPFGSESRTRSFNDAYGGFGDSYGSFGGSGYGPASYRSMGGFGGRFGDYGGYGGGEDFSGSFGGYGGGSGAGGYGGGSGAGGYGGGSGAGGYGGGSGAGGYAGGSGAGGYGGYRGESSFGYSSRYGSYMGGLGGGYGGSGLGAYGRGGGGYGSYDGPGAGGAFESGPGAGYGGAGGGLYGSRGSYGGSSRYHPYAR